MNGRPGTLNDKEIVFEWAKDKPEIPIYVAGYGPKVLAVAGREANGVIIQLADLDIIEWIMDQARAAAAEAGRDPAALEPIVCAPVVLYDDKAAARELVRWFPAMVSNHVVDLLKRYDQSLLPPTLTEYLQRREFYDYAEHSRVGAAHGSFVDDETCDRFCILGPVDDHVAKLQAMAEHGRAAVQHLPHDRLAGGDPAGVRRAGHPALPVAAPGTFVRYRCTRGWTTCTT